jgi:taurine transport system substrate-binding protein
MKKNERMFVMKRKTRKSVIVMMLIMALSVSVVLAGCGGGNDVASDPGAEAEIALPDEINIGTQQMPNDENVAKAKGFFDDLGVKVNLLEFDSGASVVSAIASGDLDLGLMGSTPATTAISNNLGVELIWIHAVLGKSEALAVRNDSGVTKVEELVGKTVATPFGSTGHYSLLSALQLAGVDASAVTVLDMQPKDISAAWQRGDIDAAYVWDPVLTELLKDGELLTTSEELAAQGIITADTEVVTTEFGEKYPELVAAYIGALEKAQQEYKSNPDDVINTLAEYFKITPEDSKIQVEGNVWLTGEEQLEPEYLGTSSAPGALAEALKKTADFLEEQKSIDKAQDLAVYQKGINPKYIEIALGKNSATGE